VICVSVRVAYWATARIVARVPPTVFYPRPRVDSALVGVVRRPAPAVAPAVVSYERMNEVRRAGFGQRRKMLRRSLAGVVDEEAFAAALWPTHSEVVEPTAVRLTFAGMIYATDDHDVRKHYVNGADLVDGKAVVSDVKAQDVGALDALELVVAERAQRPAHSEGGVVADGQFHGEFV